MEPRVGMDYTILSLDFDKKLVWDVGTYAAIKGYDAITLDGFQGKYHVVVLNRGMVNVKE